MESNRAEDGGTRFGCNREPKNDHYFYTKIG